MKPLLNTRVASQCLFIPGREKTNGRQFHLDENVCRAVAVGLTQFGCDVTTTHQARLSSQTDTKQLMFACQTRRVVITHDTDFLKAELRRMTHAGIVYCPARTSVSGVLNAAMLASTRLVDGHPPLPSRRSTRRRQSRLPPSVVIRHPMNQVVNCLKRWFDSLMAPPPLRLPNCS